VRDAVSHTYACRYTCAAYRPFYLFNETHVYASKETNVPLTSSCCLTILGCLVVIQIATCTVPLKIASAATSPPLSLGGLYRARFRRSNGYCLISYFFMCVCCFSVLKRGFIKLHRMCSSVRHFQTKWRVFIELDMVVMLAGQLGNNFTIPRFYQIICVCVWTHECTHVIAKPPFFVKFFKINY
jgi:hypothetical protein